jgi:hypothetical protein
MQLRIDPWTTRVLACVLVLGALGAVSAPAQIVSAGAVGYIDFRSGFPPFNAPFGFVTTGVRNIPIGPGGGIFLQRWHLSPLGYAEGGTALRVLAGPQFYFFNVPTNSYLIQRRNAACAPGDPPAELFTHFDAVFRLGPNGLPAHFATMGYPVVGRNAPGPGSYSIFWARLMFGFRDGPGGAITSLGSATIAYSDFRPGAFFAAFPTAARFIPQLQNPRGNRQFLVWGDILFRTRGCPLIFARADGLSVEGMTAPGGDASIGVQDDGVLPPHDPSVLDIPIEDPENVFMEMPLPTFPEDGFGTLLEEIVEDESHTVNHRPSIQPIPEQQTLEGSTLSFAVDATDPDGDGLTYVLADAPAGMAIDPNGIVTWSPGAGSTGVYQVTVKATDDRGTLSQTDEEKVTVLVEGSNHAPRPNFSDTGGPEGGTLTSLLNAYDPDGDNLTYSLAGPAPAGASLSPEGVFTLTTTEADGPRDYTIRVRVTDDGTPSLWREGSFTVHVIESNQPPRLEPIPPLKTQVGQELQYQVVASDPDLRPGPGGGVPDVLTYSLQGAPPGATIDPQTGLLTWTPTMAGSFYFSVAVRDSYGAQASQSFPVTVLSQRGTSSLSLRPPARRRAPNQPEMRP